MQNRSAAVMQHRVEPPDSLDFFPTQPWASRAFCEFVGPDLPGFDPPSQTLWEMACGEGDMARPMAESFAAVHASDVHDYGIGAAVHDFRAGCPFPEPIDWAFTNPPFNRSLTAVFCGLRTARRGAAVLVRPGFLETIGRYRGLFRDRRPALIAQYVERLPLVKGRLDPQARTATSYVWACWTAEASPETRYIWIPPCRKRLERPGDYDGKKTLAGAERAAAPADLFAGAP